MSSSPQPVRVGLTPEGERLVSLPVLLTPDSDPAALLERVKGAERLCQAVRAQAWSAQLKQTWERLTRQFPEQAPTRVMLVDRGEQFPARERFWLRGWRSGQSMVANPHQSVMASGEGHATLMLPGHDKPELHMGELLVHLARATIDVRTQPFAELSTLALMARMHRDFPQGLEPEDVVAVGRSTVDPEDLARVRNAASLTAAKPSA